MFKQRKKIEEPGHSEPDDIIDAIVDEEEVKIDRDETSVNDNANITFFNPSQLEDKSSEEVLNVKSVTSKQDKIFT